MASSCFLQGLCGKDVGNPKKAINDPVLAPFVEVTISGENGTGISAISDYVASLGGGDVTFGVGNSSFPAVVKSLRVGTSKGAGCEIEILDQEGGDFTKIFQKLTRGGTTVDSLVSVRWGWISTECGRGGVPKSCSAGSGDPKQQPEPGTCSAELRFVLKQMSVQYSYGSIKYILHCTDMMDVLFTSKSAKPFGTRKEPQFLLDAVRELFQDTNLEIVFDGVKFRNTGSGVVDPQRGPKWVWPTSNRPLLEIVHDWLRPLVQDDGDKGRGFVVLYEPSKNPPQLVVTPYIGPVCATNFQSSPWHIASYVVNGGDCSPVISFNPVVDYSGVNVYAGGGTAGGSHSGTGVSAGPAPCDNMSSLYPQFYKAAGAVAGAIGTVAKGITEGFPLSINPSGWEPLSRLTNCMAESYRGTLLNALANTPHNLIQADLRIQGDPNYSRPIDFNDHFVTVVVINPYQVESGCVWSNSVSQCCEVLSKTTWQIKGVFHDIRDGSYTTTLGLRLAAGGGELPLLAPPGAEK